MKTLNNTLSGSHLAQRSRTSKLRRIGLNLACGAMVALGLASSASAQVEVNWEITGEFVGNGYLPKSTSDGVGVMVSTFETGTGYDQVAYNTGSYGTVWNSQTNVAGEIAHSPAIAMVIYENSTGNLSDAVVEVHQGTQDNGGRLFSRVAYPADLYEELSPSNITWGPAAKYDDGYNSTVAIDGWTYPPTIVEVHQAGVNSSALWYHVGHLNFGSTPSISWGPSHEFDSGFNGYAPSVSVSDGLVILAAQGSGGTLWRALGVVNASAETINWGSPAPYGTGYNPSVSLTGDFYGDNAFEGDWELVEVHQATSGTGSLWYNTGYLNAGSGGSHPTSVNWTTPRDSEYAGSGCYPTVTQLDNGSATSFGVLETHSEDCGEKAKIVSQFGVLQTE